jgi:WD40 repeat protein
MAADGDILWDTPFVQLWHQQFNTDGSALAAIAAPAYGRWTVAVDGAPWTTTFSDMVTDLVFSPDGSRIAALAKQGQHWMVVVDGTAWRHDCDMAWRPVFAPDGQTVAAKVEKNGRYTIVLNDHLWKERFDMIWDPAFSPDGSRLLLRLLENGIYKRRIVPISTITG